MTDCLDYLQGLDDSKHLTRERSLNALSRALDEGTLSGVWYEFDASVGLPRWMH